LSANERQSIFLSSFQTICPNINTNKSQNPVFYCFFIEKNICSVYSLNKYVMKEEIRKYKMAAETNIHRESRLVKLKTLQEKGYNPYPYRFVPNTYAAELQEKYKDLDLSTLLSIDWENMSIMDLASTKKAVIETLSESMTSAEAE
jgi:hypothetical protein